MESKRLYFSLSFLLSTSLRSILHFNQRFCFILFIVVSSVKAALNEPNGEDNEADYYESNSDWENLTHADIVLNRILALLWRFSHSTVREIIHRLLFSNSGSLILTFENTKVIEEIDQGIHIFAGDWWIFKCRCKLLLALLCVGNEPGKTSLLACNVNLWHFGSCAVELKKWI